MNRVRPWVPTAITGRLQGMTVGPAAIARTIKEADNPILIVGAGIMEELEGRLADYAVRMARARDMPVAATAHTISVLHDRGIQVQAMGLSDVIARLQDPEWQGLNGRPHDVAVAVGIRPRFLNNMFNSLKNFSDVRTVSIGKHNLPNASLSLANLTDDIWEENLVEICEYLER
ncbi:MAG: CO dehydrogenase/acetyl-CoA synthase complex subunit epsilon [Euryarchaeota archaeon]|nr:CO dehydrogenase/acetyl-CoA synthase complex subunit epsilon [Euryarchaeota archaeon]